MSQRFAAVVATVALFLGVVVGGSLAWAQAPTLAEQLAAQYKLAKLGSDSSGYSITEEGTLLAVQKGGIIGVPYKNTLTRTATFQDGTVHASDVSNNSAAQKVGKLFCGLHKCPTTPDAANDERTTKLFKVGDKVYPTKIDVNLDKDQVVMAIVACDTCNKTDPPTYNKANVVFQFAKGTLAKTAAGPVEDTIGQLLTVSEDTGQQDQGVGQQQGQAQGQGQGQGQQQQGGEPQTIQMGMTMDQVQGALGQPQKIVNLGPKQIYVYKDLKVTFFGGKVVDVQ